MTLALKRLKAKVVVELTKGMPCFFAASFAQNAIESPAMTSGRWTVSSRLSQSSAASVRSTMSLVEKVRSLPRRAPSAAVMPGRAASASKGTKTAPAVSTFARKASVV